MSDFGESFRAAREARQLTVDEVAQETRVSARFLRAIEEEDFAALPGGLFSRGFVRTYAQHVGLDADEAVARFTALAPSAEKIEPSEPSEPAEPAKKVGVQTDGVERHIVPIAIGGLVVLVAIFYFFFQDSFSESAEGNPPPSAVEQTTQPDSAPAPEAPPDPQVPGPESDLPPAVRASTEDLDSAAPVATDEIESPTATTTEPDPDEPDSEVEVLPEAAVVVPPPLSSESRLLVEIDATAATWIRVQSDGAPPVELTMQPGSARAFSAERVIDMRIGNAAGVAVRINGETLPDLGGDGQVTSLNITPDNYRSLIDPD